MRYHLIEKEEKEIYTYSFEILLATVLNLIILFAATFTTGKPRETVCFLIGFIPIRGLAGGYHAKTHFRCLLILMGIYFVFLTAITFVPMELRMIINIMCILVSFFIIFLFSPAEDHNKPLSASEKLFYRRRSRIAVLIYAAVIIPLIVCFKTNIFIFCISLGVLSVACSLAAARIRSYILANSHQFNARKEKLYENF
jgi:accessory gene regulator B